MTRKHTRLWAASVAMAALVATGCAEKAGDISYVQPNYVKKSDLDGIWYIRNTVTRTPPTTGMTFSGETGKLEKIVFEIQEGHLVGYRSYATIPGQDQQIEDASKPSGTTARICKGDVCTGGQPYYGSPVVAFAISKHFDIQRGYNPQTGETDNTINENASDRPWTEREYIRVDWAHNAVGAQRGAFNEVLNFSAASDYGSMINANEPGTDPYDWPRKEYSGEGADQKLAYFEFTGRYMARPDMLEWTDDYGNVIYSAPICWYSPSYDCTAQQIEMRTSLARVDPNRTNDYEPLVYGNDMMAKFGYFRTERLNYDRRFGFFESDRINIANRHRIWKESFVKDAAGTPDFSKPIPMAERTPKPITYYVTPRSRVGGEAEYQQYWTAAKDLEAHWNVAFRRAVAAAQGKGNDLTGVPQMLYVCPNPVPNDATSDVITNCGQPGFEARFGDLRHNFLWTVPEAVPNGLLGYGPSSADPETGEIISANANTYSAAVSLYAQMGLDMVNAIVGDTTTDELIQGKDVSDYFKTHTPYAAVQGVKAPLKSALTADQVQKTDAESKGAFERQTTRLQSLMASLRASGGLPTSGGDRIVSAAEKLRTRPDLEALIVDNPEMADDVLAMLPAGMRMAAQNDPTLAREARRQILLKTPQFAAQQKAKQEYFARNNICFTLEELEDRPMFGVAWREATLRAGRITQLRAEGLSPEAARAQADEEIRVRFRQFAWRATSEHEIGHTFGLRHNFAGSFDSINYFDNFWQIRQPTLVVQQGAGVVVPRTPADLKKVSNGTEDQLALGMMDYQYSSIMDYGGKLNADWKGVGKYDEAAIIFAYSGDSAPGYVEVFDANLPLDSRQFPGSDGQQLTVTGAGYDLPIVNALKINTAVPGYTERFHYSTVPLHFGFGNDLEEVIATGIDNLKKRKLEKWSVVQARTAAVRELLKTNAKPATGDIEAIASLEVPYLFCTDDHAGSLLSCNRWDRGPDYYEVNRGWLEDYWNGYYFSHFRRDRLFFSGNRALNSSYGTFLDASSVYKHWVHAMYGASGPNAQNVPNYVNTPFGYDATTQDLWTMATVDGINDLLKVMAVPPAGLYMQWTPVDNGSPYYVADKRWDVINEGFDFDNLTPDGRAVVEEYYKGRFGDCESFQSDNCVSGFAVVPRGDARRMYSRYDYKTGFAFWDRLTEVGHYNDQIGAIFASVTPNTSFLGQDETADRNRYYIPYYLTFRDELGKTYGSLWSGNENALSPTVYLAKQDDGSLKPTVAFQTQVRGQDYVAGFDYPAPVELPQDSKAAIANQQTTWTSRIYSLYLGMALFNVNYDLDFAKQNQIIKLGGKEDLTVPAGWEKYEVEDFATGARYAALKKIGAPETSAVRMITMARYYRQVALDPASTKVLDSSEKADPVKVELTKKQYTEVFKDQVRNMDIMRGMYDLYGKAF